MKSIKAIIMMGVVALAALCSCGAKTEKAPDQAAPTDQPNMLVCYFSATGTTAQAAKRIVELTGADIYEITPEAPYTAADLDWTDSLSRSTVEMHDPASRPAMAGEMPDMAKYDVILIGYPNWWNTHPTIINTFIEANDLQGKTVAPFMTSGGSDIANSEKELKEQYPSLTFAPGLLMNDVTDEQVKEWVENL